MNFDIAPIALGLGLSACVLSWVVYRAKVADLRATLSALRISEARKSAILESALDCIVTMDSQGVIVEFNPAAERTFGYSRAEAIGKPLAQLLIPLRYRDKHQEGLERFLRTGVGPMIGRRVQLAATRSDGTEFPVELAICPILSTGPPIFTGYLRDLTENKRLEELGSRSLSFQEQSQRAGEANQLKSEFLAHISHELRTPLNAILGFAELMHSGKVGPVSPQHREFLGDILSSSRHLLQLINDLLDLSKVEAGKIEFHPEPVDLLSLVGEVQHTLRGLAADKQLEVAIQVEPQSQAISLDPMRLKQVLYNLVSNAINFTAEKGQIWIRAKSEGMDLLKFEVEDNGIGIDPRDLEQLFTDFRQTHSDGTGSGTGLGLALTKRMVEAQGGRVSVQSVAGRGATFSVLLPRVYRAQTSGIPSSEHRPAASYETVAAGIEGSAAKQGV